MKIYDYNKKTFKRVCDEDNNYFYYIKLNGDYIEVSKEVYLVCLRSYEKIKYERKREVARYVQYFEDIDDSYYYVIGEYSKEIKKYLLEDLVRCKGDIVLAYNHLYRYILDMIEDENNKEYFEKIFLNMSYDVQNMFTPNFNDGLNMIVSQVDVSKLNIASKFGLGYVLDIIESTMMNNIIKSYKRNLSREKNVEIFEKELALICVGILKK